ncbi:MAG: hypothetical protein EOS58_22875 [Mesorhizobium sp.]|uniref:hypothetical protein n=1 Tax=unclassified Mesorhizobium TaxID=325217 RepID=UPI000F74C49B|nr:MULTISPECIES: hypothetical protein [unclassified Mesorhizobium]RVC47356.1 hypothetical protein EN781_01205 [Mesorhizobium sp. M4A.F.Ca.ET.090.04.2.1]AZO49051.1 hypothetical protein EJ073_15545 [Mesorhizobium sp. M4B.F.Ca.ET.058.02.1.1]RUX51089.1 hypothetical protein EOA33_07490 [Mesorhizobium sp. M4A.F.Ca.ET.050.02.1.1]RVD45101.1 hypothetical protein EN742_00205 [Mesorhizobium sp. M4A.F.Ca.ET.020.02.1.1]RWC21216.1 MAG: hypothetical protein EOS53_06510 [Mesorhizobium sp.]
MRRAFAEQGRPGVHESHVFARSAAESPGSRAESLTLPGFAGFAAAQAHWNIPAAKKAFESLSFLFAGFLGFAAPVKAAQ